MSDEPAGSEKRRIEALEAVVRSLVGDVERLRGEVALLRGPAVPPPATAPPPVPGQSGPPQFVPPPLAPPRSSWSSSRAASSASHDLEQVVGRYGTLVVATLALLLGLGAFLQWAIARGLLGPEVRVALGAVAALALTGLGLWMRVKRSAGYGDALLVIALAIVHVDAWAAGPGLGVVPTEVALAVAAAASLALAALALREGREFLFCLGLGGALLAPFVTSAGGGSMGQLLVFGGMVIAAAIVALRDADWRVARQFLPVFAAWYMVAGAAARTSAMSANSLYWPAAFALGLALVALAFGEVAVRRELVRRLLFLLVVATFLGSVGRSAPAWTGVAYALFGTVTVHALRRRTAVSPNERPDTWYEVVGLPLLFLGCAVLVRDRYELPAGATIAAGWAALTAVFLYLDGEKPRARHLSVILTAAIVAGAALVNEREITRIAVFALIAVVSTLTLARVRGPALLLPIALSLALATGRAVEAYDLRFDWTYAPFLNEVSLLTATVVVAYALLSSIGPESLAPAERETGPWSAVPWHRALRFLGPVAAFLWARQELAGAYSADVATFLLISYYALTGVGTILLGRARNVGGLRQAGLALSLFAAFKAVSEASDVDRIGLRVGSYLVVGVFLLGVGYLYRGGVPDVTTEA